MKGEHKMLSIDERISKAEEHLKKLKQDQRLEQRRINERKKKISQRCHYIVGEMFVRFFPQCLSLNPGTKEENSVNFKPLEKFLLKLLIYQLTPEFVEEI